MRNIKKENRCKTYGNISSKNTYRPTTSTQQCQMKRTGGTLVNQQKPQGTNQLGYLHILEMFNIYSTLNIYSLIVIYSNIIGSIRQSYRSISSTLYNINNHHLRNINNNHLKCLVYKINNNNSLKCLIYKINNNNHLKCLVYVRRICCMIGRISQVMLINSSKDLLVSRINMNSSI